MHTTAAKLALVATLLVLFAPNAGAQSSRLQKLQQARAKFKDLVKCTCLFTSGARFYHRPGGNAFDGIEGMTNVDRYIACMRAKGRPNG